MTILITTAVFPPEPVVSSKISSDLAYSLIGEGHRVTVVSPSPTRPAGYKFDEDKKESMPYRHIITDSYVCPESKMLGRFRESISFGKAVSRIIKDEHERIDVIYANVWPLFSQWYIARAAKKYGIPYCMHIQDIYPEQLCQKVNALIGLILKTLLLPIDKYVLKNAHKVIAISEDGGRYLQQTRGLKDSQMRVVRNWQDDEAFQKAYAPIKHKDGKVNFMFVGTVNPTVNLEFMINAFAKVDKKKYKLSIVGNGVKKEDCKKLCIDLNVPCAFSAVTSTEVPEKQLEADVLILSLLPGVAKTATPSKLTAYMFSGRPILACVDKDSDTASIIKDSNCGIVVDPSDQQGLVEAINAFINMPVEELNSLGSSGMEMAKKRLSKEKNLEALSRIVTD